MQYFVISMIVSRAIKNIWKSSIRQRDTNNVRIYKICLNETVKVLNEMMAFKTMEKGDKLYTKLKKI